MHQRSTAIDVLRGYSIATMILSGTICFACALPAWMYHAQEPPPTHAFVPSLPGITWVDLVFPFFLFSMGAAIPFAMHKKLQTEKTINIALGILKRGLLLAFFAFFFEHIKSNNLHADYGSQKYWMSFSAIIPLSLIFGDTKKWINNSLLRFALPCMGFGIAVWMLTQWKQTSGHYFSMDKKDIIILVLANVSVAGSFIWWLSHTSWRKRILLTLPFILLFGLGKQAAIPFFKTIFDFSPLPWLFQFNFLKYLAITIPGTFVGDWILQSAKHNATVNENTSQQKILAILPLLQVIITLYGLFTRQLLLNAIFNLLILAFSFWLVQKQKNELHKKLFFAGAAFLLIGFLVDPFEGGIKKDWANFSYFLVTSGLAFLVTMSLCLADKQNYLSALRKPLASIGQNPLIAYVGVALIIFPLFNLTPIGEWMSNWGANVWTGFLKGVVATSIVCLVTIVCTKGKMFWKS
jgi:predicted acyltransferase